jgi:hypothetical protein
MLPVHPRRVVCGTLGAAFGIGGVITGGLTLGGQKASGAVRGVVPTLDLTVRIDALSGVFLVVVGLVGAAAAASTGVRMPAAGAAAAVAGVAGVAGVLLLVVYVAWPGTAPECCSVRGTAQPTRSRGNAAGRIYRAGQDWPDAPDCRSGGGRRSRCSRPRPPP